MGLLRLFSSKFKREPEDKGLGIDIIYAGSDPVVDIVALHGLNGHREKTWTYQHPDGRKTNWLRDLLPEDIPSSRILSFGYDAATHNLQQVSNLSLKDIAGQLLRELSRVRSECKNRPIIFVVHSLGGLLFKETMIRAHADAKHFDSGEKDIVFSTHAVVFLATPHLGSALANSGTVLANVVGAVTPIKTNKNMLEHLQQDSALLRNTQDGYRDFKGTIKPFYFFEGLDTNIGGKMIKVVPRMWAVPPEDTTGQNQGLNANHKDMARYRSKDDGSYLSVCDAIKGFVKNSGPAMQKKIEELPVNNAIKNVISKLESTDLNSRYSDKVATFTNHSSGDWLFSTQQFTDWERKSCAATSVLLLKGRPGSGKSVLVKSAKLRIQDTNTIALVFFFDREAKSELAVSAQGLYRSLLAQLLKSKCLSDETLGEISQAQDRIHSCDDLECALRKVLEGCATAGKRVHIYIDAIEQCVIHAENGVDRVLEFFFGGSRRSLADFQGAIRFLISSDYQSSFSGQLSDAVVLRAEDGNEEDLKKYVREKVFKLELPSKYKPYFQQLSETMVVNAAGSFTWVQFAIQDINARWQDFEPTRFLRILDAPIKGLSNNYRELLERGSLDRPQDTVAILQMVCFAMKPLSRTQLRQAMALRKILDGPRMSRLQLELNNMLDGPDFENSVRTATRGLVEFVDREISSKVNAPTGYDEPALEPLAQFVNVGVREYLIKEDGLATVGEFEEEQVEPRGHLLMAEISLRALELDNFKDDTLAPLREYASAYWMAHSRLSNDILSSLRLPSFATSCTIKTAKLLDLYKAHLQEGDSWLSPDLEDEPSFFVFLAAEGCTEILKQHCKRCKRSTCYGGATKPAEGLVRSPDSEEVVTPASPGFLPSPGSMDIIISPGSTPRIASPASTGSQGHFPSLKKTLSDAELDVEPTANVWERALYYACWANQLSTVQYISSISESIECDPNRMVTFNNAFYRSCRCGHLDIIAALMHWGNGKGVDIFASNDDIFKTGIHIAVKNRLDNVIHTLFENSDEDDQEKLLALTVERDMTPLHVAAAEGWDDIVRTLLDKVVDLQCEGRILSLKTDAGRGFTALQVAEELKKANVVDVFEELVGDYI